MFPNIDNKSIEFITYVWATTVDNEANTAKFLEEINVPGLNRKKAYLEISSNEISYKLPVLVSDSFEQYKEKGWFIRDNKNPQSSFVSDKEKGHWEYDFKVWEEPIKPLIRDVTAMVLNGFTKITGDAGNIVLKENDNGNFEFHYFGFDFDGLPGKNNCVPSEAKQTEYQKYSPRDVCSTIAKKAKLLISDVVYHSLYNLNLGKEAKKSSEVTEEFSYEVGEHFLTCDFITQVVGENFHSNYSEEL